MLFLILIFLAIALFASLLGYEKIASEASLTAIFLFGLFLIMFIVRWIVKYFKRRKQQYKSVSFQQNLDNS